MTAETTIKLWMAGVDDPEQGMVRARLTYDPARPFAVRLAFLLGAQETVAFTFERDLISLACDDRWDKLPPGDRVEFRPHPYHARSLVLTLTADASLPADYFVSRDHLLTFVASTIDVVAPELAEEIAQQAVESLLADILRNAT